VAPTRPAPALPQNAKLWDVGHAPTIIMTQRGARRPFQRLMRSRGVEVVEFDFLTPEAVARYCAERGWLQCLWECGGVLAAPAIAGGAVHRIMGFVAPKLVRWAGAAACCNWGLPAATGGCPLRRVAWQ
jgi:diaminohydroxyphosphoribosylaminopyrimidine deaminase/5-amino-6-(5-phosphoribosylamino)uracil reductase